MTALRAPRNRRWFAEEVGRALGEEIPWATGKLGVTERSFLMHRRLLRDRPDPHRLAAFELSMRVRGLRQAGIFPAEAEFYREFTPRYRNDVAALDCIGVFPQHERATVAVIGGLGGELVSAWDQEPDRSSPDDPERCFLPRLAGRRVLLVSPFAELLRQRRNAETFEAVWAKTGKRWFHPAAIDAVELPYGFAAATHRSYATALDLRDHVAAEMAARDYDIALIAAGGLGIPLAVAAKQQGRVGLSLGGHLQIVFGILGARWRERGDWQERYFNDAWIDLPQRYRPDPATTGENYW